MYCSDQRAPSSICAATRPDRFDEGNCKWGILVAVPNLTLLLHCSHFLPFAEPAPASLPPCSFAFLPELLLAPEAMAHGKDLASSSSAQPMKLKYPDTKYLGPS